MYDRKSEKWLQNIEPFSLGKQGTIKLESKKESELESKLESKIERYEVS